MLRTQPNSEGTRAVAFGLLRTEKERAIEKEREIDR